jgi:acetyltransferase-like isoleucine patch superfamily enzyme
MNLINFFKRKIKNTPFILPIVSSLYLKLIGNNKFKKMGSKNIIKVGTSIVRNSVVFIKGNFNEILIGNDGRLDNLKINIQGNYNRIYIDDSTNLNEAEFWIEDDYGKISIGKKTTVQGKTHFACIEGCEIKVGQDCMFSTEIVFRTGDSHSIIDSNGIRINKSKNIIVGNHVWLGNKTIINKGVEILDNCIVGAGSIVTKSLGDTGAVIVGAPARVVSRNVNWLRERI